MRLVFHSTVEVGEWMKNFIPLYGHVITYHSLQKNLDFIYEVALSITIQKRCPIVVNYVYSKRWL